MTAKTWRTYVSALFALVLAAGATLVFSGVSHAVPEYPPGVPPGGSVSIDSECINEEEASTEATVDVDEDYPGTYDLMFMVDGQPAGTTNDVSDGPYAGPTVPNGSSVSVILKAGDESVSASEVIVIECGEPTTTSTPSLAAQVSSVCLDDVPYLDYTVTLQNLEATTVNITWVNPGGQSVTLENQPLTGRLLWLGTIVDSNGVPQDWPGWVLLPNGEWVEADDGFAWVRPTLSITFQVNPSTTVQATYPQPGCAPTNTPPNEPPTTTSVPPPTEVTTPPVTETTPPTTTTTTTTTSSDLPNSGFQASNLLWAGLALVAVGGLATFLVRRGRSS